MFVAPFAPPGSTGREQPDTARQRWNDFWLAFCIHDAWFRYRQQLSLGPARPFPALPLPTPAPGPRTTRETWASVRLTNCLWSRAQRAADRQTVKLTVKLTASLTDRLTDSQAVSRTAAFNMWHDQRWHFALLRPKMWQRQIVAQTSWAEHKGSEGRGRVSGEWSGATSTCNFNKTLSWSAFKYAASNPSPELHLFS